METTNTDYSKVKTQMRQLIKMANEVIEETEKESPDKVHICDIAIEEMAELFDQIETTILGSAESNG